MLTIVVVGVHSEHAVTLDIHFFLGNKDHVATIQHTSPILVDNPPTILYCEPQPFTQDTQTLHHHNSNNGNRLLTWLKQQGYSYKPLQREFAHGVHLEALHVHSNNKVLMRLQYVDDGDSYGDGVRKDLPVEFLDMWNGFEVKKSNLWGTLSVDGPSTSSYLTTYVLERKK